MFSSLPAIRLFICIVNIFIFIFIFTSSDSSTVAGIFTTPDSMDDTDNISHGHGGRELTTIGNAMFARTADDSEASLGHGALPNGKTRVRERNQKKSRRNRSPDIDSNRKFLQQEMSNGKLSAEDLAIPFNLTPGHDTATRDFLRSIRRKALEVHSDRYPPCGVIYSLSSLNGTNTNYALMERIGSGESIYRLQSVIYEAVVSAARVRSALTLHPKTPSICSPSHNQTHPKRTANIEVSLFIDRDIVNYFQGKESLLDFLLCSFDHIFYYDEFLSDDNSLFSLNLRQYTHRDIFARLSPRPNAMKMLTFLLTPYRHTLYLDGDTAPCLAFQVEVFNTLRTHDILATANPFGFVSTNEMKTFLNAPNHPAFEKFEEINGGVFAYSWSERTFDLFLRSMELIPSFAILGFDQDQAMMRQALFEGIVLHGLTVSFEPMDKYCRFGWNCEKNDCTRCTIIHTRLCTDLGVGITTSVNNNARTKKVDKGGSNHHHHHDDSNNTSRCDVRMKEAHQLSRLAMQKYLIFNSLNRKTGIARIIKKIS